MFRRVGLGLLTLVVVAGCSSTPGSEPTTPDPENAAPESHSPAEGTTESSEFESDRDAPWQAALDDAREFLAPRGAEAHPLDFAVSENVPAAEAETIRTGVTRALSILGPQIDSERPLAVTVVHPLDKEWFLERWEQLGRDNTGEFWWDKSQENGGGAVGWGDDLVPNMYYMVSGDYPPTGDEVDYYVHETLHFLQVLAFGDINDRDGMCWIPEGTAMFVGAALSYFDDNPATDSDRLASIEHYRFVRDDISTVLAEHYSSVDNLQDQLVDDIVRFPAFDQRCQFDPPQFGYTLGMLVTEQFVLDFGSEDLFDFFYLLDENSISDAFFSATGVDYEEWVTSQASIAIANHLTGLADEVS